MYSLTPGSNLILTISAISMVCSTSINPEGEPKGDAQVSRTSQWANRLHWEDILRESVFRTISPPPLANNLLYKRILTAMFYHGPLPAETENDPESVALSSGSVHQLANGNWILCQDGCQDCEPCIRATRPVIRWIIRRIKRSSTYGAPRHDLQLTIIPQSSGNHHMASDSPRSYVYVASAGEVLAHSTDAYVDDEDAFGNYSSARHGMTDGFRSQPIDRGNISIGDQTPSTATENSTASKEPVLGRGPKSENNERQEQFWKQRPPVGIIEKPEFGNNPKNGSKETKEPSAQLILGTDQLGQKHLVHVVVADGESDYSKHGVQNTWPGLEETRLVNDSGKPDYQELLRRIFHSLVSHRRSIERFLQSPSINGDGGSLSASIAGDGVKDELELGHRMKGMNPAIGFYPSYNEANNSQSAMGTRRSVVLRQLRERRRSESLISTTEILNSIKNDSQVIGTYFKLDTATRANFNAVISRAGKNVSESIAEIRPST